MLYMFLRNCVHKEKDVNVLLICLHFENSTQLSLHVYYNYMGFHADEFGCPGLWSLLIHCELRKYNKTSIAGALRT